MAVIVKLVSRYSPWLYAVGVLGILFYLRAAFLARRERAQASFTLEREAATAKVYRALFIALGFAAEIGFVFFITAVLTPHLELPPEVSDAQMVFIFPTSTPTPIPPTPTLTPTPSASPATPTKPPQTPTPLPTPTNTPIPAPICPNPQARITSPGMDAVLNGAVPIVGSANIPNFQYYKVEVGPGENPASWSLITDLRYTQVAGGQLDIWDTTPFPSGVYTIRLVVVDNTGNFPEPCEVRVTVKH
ncbi:MAG: hypothetical protein ACUVV0_12905 [Anaerolineae bacterium]